MSTFGLHFYMSTGYLHFNLLVDRNGLRVLFERISKVDNSKVNIVENQYQYVFINSYFYMKNHMNWNFYKANQTKGFIIYP